MGRPTKLTDEAQDDFIKAVSAGVPVEVAARYAGFSVPSLYRYLRGTTPRHLEFRQRYMRALTALQMQLAMVVLQAGRSDPRWAMEILQRRWPQHWGRQPTDDLGLEPLERARPTAEPLLRVDPALLGELIPRLLEAGQRLSGRQVGDAPLNLSEFTDDGNDQAEGDEVEP